MSLVQIGPVARSRSNFSVPLQPIPSTVSERELMDNGVGDNSASLPTTQIVFSSCFGLPYQDHNYGAPPPPSPPLSPNLPPAPPPFHGMSALGVPFMTPVTLPRLNGHIDIENVSSTTEVITTTASLEHLAPFVPIPQPQYTAEDGITRCICDFQHDDGYMICCDQCCVWQHVDCMGVDRDAIPDNYLCEKCDIRRVDKHNAVTLQRMKRQQIPGLAGTSSTETENETNQRYGVIDPLLRKKKPLNKLKKERDNAKLLRKNNKKGKNLRLKMALGSPGERFPSNKLSSQLMHRKNMPISPKKKKVPTATLR